MLLCVLRMDGQAKKWHLAFFMGSRVGVPAIVLRTHAVLVQSLTITQMSKAMAIQNKGLERFTHMKYHRGDVPPGAPGRPLRGNHDDC